MSPLALRSRLVLLWWACATSVAFVAWIAELRATCAGRAHPDQLERYKRTESHMGTYFTIILYAPDEQEAETAFRAAFSRIAELDHILSDYDPESELNRLCRRAGTGPVPVSEDLYRVLEESLRISRLTHGAFDVTVWPVVRLWRRAHRQKKLPRPDRLQAALKLVGYDNIVLHPEKRTVELKKRGMRIDLGGIGKGYALDQVVALLRTRGIESILVDGGGDIATGAAPPDRAGWVIAVPMPTRSEAVYLVVSNTAVATSGDAERFVVLDGVRYSHIVDPRTGVAVRGPRQVTVVHSCAMTADAFATALSVMKVTEAMEFARAHELAAQVVVEENGEFRVFRSPLFETLATQADRLLQTGPDQQR